MPGGANTVGTTPPAHTIASGSTSQTSPSTPTDDLNRSLRNLGILSVAGVLLIIGSVILDALVDKADIHAVALTFLIIGIVCCCVAFTGLIIV